MNILVADFSGFCFGVKKAVDTAYDKADSSGNVYTYGPLIHNSTVVNELEQKGVRQLDSIESLKEGDTVILRSHGVPKRVIHDLNGKRINVIDATCPYVGHIHKKVEEYYNKGYQIIIIGDSTHPEVEGIHGWCEYKALVVNCEDEAQNMSAYPKLCIVAQTTMNMNRWKSIVASLLDKSKEIIIFNTICSATEQRQKSAEELSKKCDAVIVLGGYNSSNTKKLVDICKKNCQRIYHVESINELSLNTIHGVTTLGITAGASTPDWIIKEAIDKMNTIKNTQEDNNEQNVLMEEYDKTVIRLHDGEIVTGKVIYVTDNEAAVDVGYKADGIISREELTFDGDVSPKDVLKPGDEVEVFILRVNDGEGNVLLSKKRADAEKNWEYVEEFHKNRTLVEARVKQAVKGGLTAEVKGINVFIPASQIDVRYVENLSDFAGKMLNIVIIEFDPNKRRVIGSRKVVLQEEMKKKREAVLNSISEGDILSGNVSRIADFGVFVDLGGIDGLIHISELSWGRIKHPSSIVKPGDDVEVYVLSVDKEKERISLSLRKTVPQPWETIGERIHVGDVIEGKVVRLAPFGAFVEIEKGVDGLVHISQISNKRINKVEDELNVGDTIKAKVMELNIEENKMSLSIRELIEDEIEKENETVINEAAAKVQEEDNITIGDILQNKETE